MTGETNISALVKGMTPNLNDGEYVFCTLKNANKTMQVLNYLSKNYKKIE